MRHSINPKIPHQLVTQKHVKLWLGTFAERLLYIQVVVWTVLIFEKTQSVELEWFHKKRKQNKNLLSYLLKTTDNSSREVIFFVITQKKTNAGDDRKFVTGYKKNEFVTPLIQADVEVPNGWTGGRGVILRLPLFFPLERESEVQDR